MTGFETICKRSKMTSKSCTARRKLTLRMPASTCLLIKILHFPIFCAKLLYHIVFLFTAFAIPDLLATGMLLLITLITPGHLLCSCRRLFFYFLRPALLYSTHFVLYCCNTFRFNCFAAVKSSSTFRKRSLQSKASLICAAGI